MVIGKKLMDSITHYTLCIFLFNMLMCLNMRSEQLGCHFADEISEYILWDKVLIISFKFQKTFVHSGPVFTEPARATSHYLN